MHVSYPLSDSHFEQLDENLLLCSNADYHSLLQKFSDHVLHWGTMESCMPILFWRYDGDNRCNSGKGYSRRQAGIWL